MHRVPILRRSKHLFQIPPESTRRRISSDRLHIWSPLSCQIRVASLPQTAGGHLQPDSPVSFHQRPSSSQTEARSRVSLEQHHAGMTYQHIVNYPNCRGKHTVPRLPLVPTSLMMSLLAEWWVQHRAVCTALPLVPGVWTAPNLRGLQVKQFPRVQFHSSFRFRFLSSGSMVQFGSCRSSPSKVLRLPR